MNGEKYEMAECILSSADREKLHEAILDTQNFLAYNGSWDFHAETIVPALFPLNGMAVFPISIILPK